MSEIPWALVVDDDPASNLILRSILEKFGIACDVAASFASARLALEKRTYDVLFADIGLGDGSGLDLIPLRDYLNHLADMKVVILSAYDKDEVLSKCNGADVVLQKPSSFDRIRDVCVHLRILPG